jgi:hypothetical protein
MKRQGPDPVIYVVFGLVILTLLCVFAAFAGRSCAKSAQDAAGYSADKAGTGTTEDFFKNAQAISPAAFAEFTKQLETVDLGIGVRPGMGEQDLKRALGEPDSTTRAGGSLIYAYMFPPSAKGPFPSERRQGGFKELVRIAMLQVTMKDGKSQEILLTLSPLEKSPDAWGFLRLNGKALAGCKPGDFTAALGKTSHEPSSTNYFWCFTPDTPETLFTRQYAYVSAGFSREGGTLSDLNIRIGSEPAAPPAKPANSGGK